MSSKQPGCQAVEAAKKANNPKTWQEARLERFLNKTLRKKHRYDMIYNLYNNDIISISMRYIEICTLLVRR